MSESPKLNQRRKDLPTGTVTFLFTDVQGSTDLVKNLGEDYVALMNGHHRIIRGAISRWHGTEVRTQGDSFFITFPRANDAVAATVDMQRALGEYTGPQDTRLRVRMGLHTGQPWVAVDDYEGIDIHRAARIAATGHGGQILLSETTTALVRDDLPEGISLKDLGSHRLKDMRRPEKISQLVIPDLPSDFPAIKSLDSEPVPALRGSIRGYELQQPLGKGVFGEIFLARQPTVHRDVAIKTILPGYANDPDFIRRFEAEAQMVASLEHPYIVPLYDYWREPGGAYLVMRYLRAGSLEDALTFGPWQGEYAAQLVDQVSAGLAYAHRQGVVHRDIKPANILLDESGNAYLTDFGIATLAGSFLSQIELQLEEEHKEYYSGSLGYQSPEVASGDPVTQMADIYSLGVVLYQLVTARKPFPNLSGDELIQAHRTKPIPSVLELRPELPPAVNDVIQKATAKEPTSRYPDALQLATAFKQAILAEAVEFPPEMPLEIENPYKGLRAFQEADAGEFFGRAAMIQRLVKRFDEEDGESSRGRFLAVVGPSGSGKSSLVRAGLVPALRRGAVPGSDSWFIVDMIPGPHPFEELEAALLRVAVNPPESLLGQLQEDERGLIRAVKRCLPPDDDIELLLIVDQFEELFTLVSDEAVRARFLESLLSAIIEPRSRLRMVITLRADLTDKPLQYVDFGELLRERTEFILPLTPDELDLAITGPARQVCLVPEPGLVNRIVHDVSDQPGTLPLLQYALTELFERREGRRLTLEAYDESGGVLGALGRRAEEIFTRQDQAGREATRQVFLRLVTLGEGVEDTRRRVLRSEVVALNVELSTAQTFNTVLDTFGRHRLFTFDHDLVTREPTVEVAHEALLREWPRLRAWLDDSREDIRLQRQLSRAAGEWVESEHDSSFLIPGGAKLDQFTTWRGSTGLALTQVEADFLQASIIADSEQKQRQAQQERTRRNLQRGFVGALIVGLIVAIGLSAFAFNQRQEARRQASIGLASLAEGELESPDRQLGVLLALEAVEHYPYTPQAAGALAQAVEEYRAFRTLDARDVIGHLLMVATWSPDGGRVAAGSSQSPNSVVIWAADTGDVLLAVNTHGELCKENYHWLHDLAWSPDGDRLAAAAQDPTSGEPCGTVILDTASGETLLTLVGYESAARSLDWSPDGTTILTAHEDGSARLWDANTGMERLTLTGHTGVVRDAVFSPDGGRIASASEDGTVRIWDAETGSEQMVLSGHAGPVLSVAWSPDGVRLVTGGTDGLPRVWDVASGDVLFVMRGHTEDVVIVTWSSDGRRIASQSFDATVKVWDAATGGLIFQIPNAAPAESKRGFVEFSPDGKWILTTGSRVLGIHLWDTSISVPKLFGHTFGQEWGEWSPDGSLIATSGSDGSARLWDASTGEQLRVFDQGSFWSDWSPDGTRLVFAEGVVAQTISVWDAFSGEKLSSLSAPDDEYGPHQFLTMAWSPDGSFISAGDFRPGTSQAIYVWDAETTEFVTTIRTDDLCALGWPRWSPDSTRIAGGCIFVESGINTPARIWDAATGEELMRLDSEYGWTYRTVWSPDGTQILTTHENGAALIWDAETGEPILTFTEHQAQVDGEWSPDGTLIASTDYGNQIVKIWDSKTGEELSSFTVPGAPLTINWSPDGTHVIITGDGMNEPVIKRVWASTEELIEHAYECCVSRELTPEERAQFGLPPQP